MIEVLETSYSQKVMSTERRTYNRKMNNVEIVFMKFFKTLYYFNYYSFLFI
jgi:hypothetical protein